MARNWSVAQLGGEQQQRQGGIRTTVRDLLQRGFERGASLADIHVDARAQRVAGRRGRHELLVVGAEFGDRRADAADEPTQRGLPTRRQLVAPDHGRETLAGNRPVRQREGDDGQSHPASTECVAGNLAVVLAHGDRAKNAYSHIRESSYRDARGGVTLPHEYFLGESLDTRRGRLQAGDIDREITGKYVDAPVAVVPLDQFRRVTVSRYR